MCAALPQSTAFPGTRESLRICSEEGHETAPLERNQLRHHFGLPCFQPLSAAHLLLLSCCCACCIDVCGFFPCFCQSSRRSRLLSCNPSFQSLYRFPLLLLFPGSFLAAVRARLLLVAYPGSVLWTDAPHRTGREWRIKLYGMLCCRRSWTPAGRGCATGSCTPWRCWASPSPPMCGTGERNGTAECAPTECFVPASDQER